MRKYIEPPQLLTTSGSLDGYEPAPDDLTDGEMATSKNMACHPELYPAWKPTAHTWMGLHRQAMIYVRQQRPVGEAKLRIADDRAGDDRESVTVTLTRAQVRVLRQVLEMLAPDQPD